MKRYISLLLIVLMFCAVVSVGCGGSSDSPDTEQTESLNENTGGEDTGDYAPNEESRGTSGTPPTDLSKITADYIAKDGETLMGTLGAIVKISIADGASVVLRDVTINGVDEVVYKWAGLNCSGDATIILEGNNSVTGFNNDYPGIHVPEHKTLTIKGSGSLKARSNGWGAGIGGGLWIPCGNIVIEGGTVSADGGWRAAGIGGGDRSSCGNITITGGTVTAKKGGVAPYSIGAGDEWGTCGKVTIGGLEVTVSDDSFTYIGGKITDLSTITADYTAQDREMLTGTLGANVNISIADGATAALWNVTINGMNNEAYKWAGLTCSGNATIILEGRNSIKGFYELFPGIHASTNKTLTITGTGSLEASSNGWAAGIGAGYERPCGNIVIEGGTITATGGDCGAGIGGGFEGNCGDITITSGYITATGGNYGAGIGGGFKGNCGDITITSGYITATGGDYGAGIGGGFEGNCGNIVIEGGTIIATSISFGAGIGGGDSSNCGDITIKDTVTKVTANKGWRAPYSIGKGASSECGKVTLPDQKGSSSDNPYIYPPDAQ